MKTVSLAVAALVVIGVSGNERPSRAADNAATRQVRALMRLLEESVFVKDFTNPMTFREATELLMEQFTAKGKDLPILVEVEAFTRSDAGNVYDAPVQFQPWPKILSGWELLEKMLAQVSPEAALTIRRGAIVITTREQVSFDQLRKRKVRAAFYALPLQAALEELADQTGVDITLDKRCDKAASKITAIFRNSTLEDAVRLLADQADLKAVALPSGFYVTSQENTKFIEREQSSPKDQ